MSRKEIEQAKEIEEQCRLNGKGSEREAALLAKLDQAERALEIANMDLDMVRQTSLSRGNRLNTAAYFIGSLVGEPSVPQLVRINAKAVLSEIRGESQKEEESRSDSEAEGL